MKKCHVGMEPLEVIYRGDESGNFSSRDARYMTKVDRGLMWQYCFMVSFEEGIGFVRWEVEFILLV